MDPQDDCPPYGWPGSVCNWMRALSSDECPDESMLRKINFVIQLFRKTGPIEKKKGFRKRSQPKIASHHVLPADV